MTEIPFVDEAQVRADLTERCPDLTPAEILQIAAGRVIIERAKGVLMAVYDIDADQAFEITRSQSQSHNVKVRVVAQQLMDVFEARPGDRPQNLRVACDNVVLPHSTQ